MTQNEKERSLHRKRELQEVDLLEANVQMFVAQSRRQEYKILSTSSNISEKD